MVIPKHKRTTINADAFIELHPHIIPRSNKPRG